MKILDMSATTTTNVFFSTSGTLTFLQQAYTELFAQTIQALIGVDYDPTKVYVLNGCVQTTITSGEYSYTAGIFFFNGEVFISPVQPLVTVLPGQTVIINIDPTVLNSWIEPDGVTNADPAQFSDTVARDVHDIRQALIINGTPGTGTLSGGTAASNYSNWVYVSLDLTNIAEEIAALNYEVFTVLEGDIATLNSEVSTINGEISTIDSALTTIEGDITTINTNIAAITAAPTWASIGGFQTGWASLSSPYVAQYCKDPLGNIILRGGLNYAAGLTTGAYTNAAVLPSGYRPLKNMTFVVNGYTTGIGYPLTALPFPVSVAIGTDGTIYVNSNTAGILNIDLSGIRIPNF